jgi:hypothetical protein
MRLNLAKMDEAVWVDWKHGVRVKIRPLPTSKAIEIQKRATKRNMVFVNGRREFRDEIDNAAYDALLQEHLIEDWDGFVDQNDQPIPCTPENKKAILDFMHEFRLFVVMAGKELEELKLQAREEDQKNS